MREISQEKKKFIEEVNTCIDITYNTIVLPTEQLKMPYNKYCIIRAQLPKSRVAINYKGFPIIVAQRKINDTHTEILTMTKPRER